MPGRATPAATFQDLILRLERFWADYGCIIGQPFDGEKGAGTYNPHTFLRALGPEPWKVAYVEPSRRPTDGRYGDNPNRLFRHHQYQVILKPSPEDVQDLYLRSMQSIGIHPEEHDIRFVEDNWESPTLGAWGLGWEVWVDGMELTQFTYFQQCGGLECRPVCAELTYGLERIAMYLQSVDNVYDLTYAPGVKYREVFHRDEYEYSKFTFEHLDVPMYLQLYESCEKETARLVENKLVIPAYDHLLKAAHAFNSLDARGAISVTERQGYILRIRDLAKMCAEGYLALREELGFPLLKETGGDGKQPVPSPAEVKLTGPSTHGELFVEIGCEELPAAEVLPAVGALRDGIAERLSAQRLSHGAPKIYASPRRLTVVFPDVPDRQEDRTVEVAGPPVKAAFKDGEPTKAAIGFAKGQGVEVSQLVRKETPKGEYLYAVISEAGQPTRSLVSTMITETIAALPFKRSMRWGSGDATFSRPVQWIVALFAGEVVPLQYGNVVSGRNSRGHRFLAPAPFAVESGAQYVRELASRSVLVDHVERRRRILEGAQAEAKKVGGTLLADDALIDEITQLVENPVPLLNEFDARFLEIPDEVLISEMQHHQRYLPVVGADKKLLPYFVVVANTVVENPQVSLDGYRRVLTARFEDGAFFFKEDQKVSLAQRTERLKSVRFHRALGTIYEKVERAGGLAFWLARAFGHDLPAGAMDLSATATGPKPSSPSSSLAYGLARGAYLMKADLTTQMVFEFPELQGVMGAHYARLADEPEDVSQAIFEHYLPRGAEDELPKGELGALLGIADRLDSIAGIFSTGKGPTGTADPFGLRRASLGIIRILRDRALHLSLEQAIDEAIRLIGAHRTKETDVAKKEVLDFFRTRLRGVMTAEGVPADVAEAVLSAGFDDMVDALSRAHALAKLRATPEFEPIAVTFKRVGNIIKDQEPGAVADTLAEPVEKKLHETSVAVAARVARAVAARDFSAALASIAELRPAVDAFFEGVMVLDEDPAVRQRRVALLQEAHRIFAPLADLTKLS